MHYSSETLAAPGVPTRGEEIATHDEARLVQPRCGADVDRGRRDFLRRERRRAIARRGMRELPSADGADAAAIGGAIARGPRRKAARVPRWNARRNRHAATRQRLYRRTARSGRRLFRG